MRRRSSMILAIFLAGGSLRADTQFVIIQPGYPGSTEEGETFVGDLSLALAKAGGPKDLRGSYYNVAEDGLEAVAARKPVFAIVSLGFYLAHREGLRLAPLLESSPLERFYLAAKKGQGALPADLEGQAIAGTPFHEKEFVERILFGAGAGGGPVADGEAGKMADPKVTKDPASGSKKAIDLSRWKVEVSQGFSKGVRDASKGKIRAVLLTERERRAMKETIAGREMEVSYQSEELPTALLVSLGPAGAAAQAAAKAMEALKGNEEGRGVLATMGIDGFTRADAKRIAALEARYGPSKRDDAPPGAGKDASAK